MAKIRSQADVEQVRSQLQAMHEQTEKLLDRLTEDHRSLRVCSGYPDFQKENPRTHFERAGQRLARKEYKVAFAGPFKAGKSTFLSALLKHPGMLPAEDAECTFSVGVIAAPGAGEDERVEVTYHGREEVLVNLLSHMRYRRLFEWDTATRDRVLRETNERAILAFIAESAQKARGGDANEEADELLGFVDAFAKFSDRLGRDHIDTLKNLPLYVRKEEGIGHLLLIKIVHIYMNNVVLAKQGIHIADTPGTDSINQAAREITFGYLKEADAVVYLAEARGLSLNFNDIREQLAKYHNSIREKMFVVANKADWYEVKSMRKEGGAKAPIEIVYENIVNPLRSLNLDETKFFFTCGRIAELDEKRMQGRLLPEEESQHATMRQALDDKLNALSPDITPALLEKLKVCFTDGGIDTFRQVLIDYLDIDIQVERLKEIFTDLSKVYRAAKMLLDPEKGMLQDAVANMKTQGMQVQEFFDKVRETFAATVSAISKAVEKVAGGLTDRLTKQIQVSFSKAIDRFNIEQIRVRMPVQLPMNIMREVIERLKALLSERFSQVVRESFAPLMKSRLHQQISEAKITEVIQAVAAQTDSRHAFRLEHIMEEFDRVVDQFTAMRANEETWELQAQVIEPGSFEPQWTPQVEQTFREQLKRLFVDRFVGYVSKVGAVIGRHYQALLADLIRRFDQLVDEVAKDVKKDPDRVQLPSDIMGGGITETDEEKRARALVVYFQYLEKMDGAYNAAANYLRQ